MFAKRLIQKATHHHHHDHPQHNVGGCLNSEDLDLRINIHYGIPSTGSVLAFDPIQQLLAIGTLDGRIKIIGGDNIEGLLISPQQLPYKYLEFIQNQGFLISILNDNDIQVWNLESRCIACHVQWESNITAFSVICGSPYIYIGDEFGLVSVLKYEAENRELLQLPYHVSAHSLMEAAGFPFPDRLPIVGVLPQPCSSGNRVLIAYENGLIILWDVVEARIVIVKGDKVLQLKDSVVDAPNESNSSLSDNSEEKEISTLCWASSNGSILAVGYIDGDILFWKTTAASVRGQKDELSSNNVIKLQLSSAERRLPVIVLHWCPKVKSRNDGDGQLFIYGGDEIGSEEVLTVLSLEWSSDMETVRCVGRVDLTLAGSFADMTLLPTAGVTESKFSAVLCLLANPGQLQIFDCARLSASLSQKETKISDSTGDFPIVVPTVHPLMAVAELFLLRTNGNSSKAASKIAALKKPASTPNLPGGTMWPLTGGVPNHLAFAEDQRTERVYVAGYQDGSVRIWDATYPVLSLIFIFEGQAQSTKLASSRAPISKVAFCFLNLCLAAGDECGLVRLYDLNDSLGEMSFHFVTETGCEVHNFPQSQGPHCRAMFSLQNSPVQTLEFVSHGAKLIAGYECGRVAVLDTNALSILFLTDCISGPSSSVISVTWKAFLHTDSHVTSLKHSGSQNQGDHAEELFFILTKDAKVYVLSGDTGNSISPQPMRIKKASTAISMYVIEGNLTGSGLISKRQQLPSSKDAVVRNEPTEDIIASKSNQHVTEHHPSLDTQPGECLMDSLILLCCKDALRLYTTISVVQGDNKTVCKVKLGRPCCWTATFMKDEEVCGLVLLYETGDIEIRSLPDLGLVKETSLMSILRWNFKANMERTISSTDDGHVTLANGCEVAFISLLASEHYYRIPESVPCLHDKVLAAAAEAAINYSFNEKKRQGSHSSILGGIVKGFKGGKMNHALDLAGCSKSNFSHLEDTFSNEPFPAPSPNMADNQEAVVLNIDDIEIDEPMPMASASTQTMQNNDKDKGTEREKLFTGEATDVTPRLRTREEIIATYRKAGDASSVAGQAKNKLLERQEKLERISKQTEQLQSGAEDFASLANELVKAMERRKWWQI